MLTLPDKVEKLIVTAFKDPGRKKSPQGFKFLINPAAVDSKHENHFSNSRRINTSGRKAPYSFSKADQLAIQLTVDNTLSDENLPGSPPAKYVSVKEKIDKFLKYCFYMDGDIHEPRFLKLKWGKFEFECRLKSIAISYSHFNAKGEALRAKLDTVFVEDIPDAKRIRLENKKSPDITHSRTVLQGDTLTGLTREVYGDASYYLLVAEANQLDHFRNLKAGERLHFPPIEK